MALRASALGCTRNAALGQFADRERSRRETRESRIMLARRFTISNAKLHLSVRAGYSFQRQRMFNARPSRSGNMVEKLTPQSASSPTRGRRLEAGIRILAIRASFPFLPFTA